MTNLDPQKKRVGWSAVAVSFVFALSLAARHCPDKPSKQVSTSLVLTGDDKAVNARAVLNQQQLVQVMGRPASTIDDYVANTLAARPVVEEAKGLVRLQMASLARKKQQYAEDSPDATALDYALRLLGKDEEFIYLVSGEVSCALALRSMPQKKRVAYYENHVLPIKDKERQVGQEFSAIAKEGQEKGVSWPESVKHMLQ